MRYDELIPRSQMRPQRSHGDALRIYDPAANNPGRGHPWTLTLSNGVIVHFCWADGPDLWSRVGSSTVYTDRLTGPRDRARSKANLQNSVSLLAAAMNRRASIRCVVLGGDKRGNRVLDVPTQLRGRVRRANPCAGEGIEIVFEVEGDRTGMSATNR